MNSYSLFRIVPNVKINWIAEILFWICSDLGKFERVLRFFLQRVGEGRFSKNFRVWTEICATAGAIWKKFKLQSNEDGWVHIRCNLQSNRSRLKMGCFGFCPGGSRSKCRIFKNLTWAVGRDFQNVELYIKIVLFCKVLDLIKENNE